MPIPVVISASVHVDWVILYWANTFYPIRRSYAQYVKPLGLFTLCDNS